MRAQPARSGSLIPVALELMVRIDPVLLESRLALPLGDPPRRPVRFEPALELTSPGGRSWNRLVDTIVADLEGGGPVSSLRQGH